jgi:hypothetical protein
MISILAGAGSYLPRLNFDLSYIHEYAKILEIIEVLVCVCRIPYP